MGLPSRPLPSPCKQGSSAELRELAAEGLGELVEVTGEDALKPFVVQVGSLAWCACKRRYQGVQPGHTLWLCSPRGSEACWGDWAAQASPQRECWRKLWVGGRGSRAAPYVECWLARAFVWRGAAPAGAARPTALRPACMRP